MRYGIKLAFGALPLMLLASCGTFDGVSDSKGPETVPVASSAPMAGVDDVPVKLGASFTVGGTTYTPEDVPNYDEVGYASWYGNELAGRPTANGENFVPSAITAAHKTLPMPSYVEVTALDTGRTIVVRVNDRGPFANDRLIDLSEGAAQQLGISGQGVAGVRVRRVNPPEQERAVLRSGMAASSRMDTPESLLKVLRDKLAKQPRPKAMAAAVAPKPVATTPAARAPATGNGRFVREGAGASRNAPAAAAPTTAATSGYVVQVAAFSSRARADDLAKKLGATTVASADGRLFRVRFGPYGSETEAQRALASARQRGYPQARLLRE